MYVNSTIAATSKNKTTDWSISLQNFKRLDIWGVSAKSKRRKLQRHEDVAFPDLFEAQVSWLALKWFLTKTLPSNCLEKYETSEIWWGFEPQMGYAFLEYAPMNFLGETTEMAWFIPSPPHIGRFHWSWDETTEIHQRNTMCFSFPSDIWNLFKGIMLH